MVWGVCVGAWLPVSAAEPAVTISEKTTRITEPLRKDGFPDYVAALNDICAEGVTADNNAAVLFMQAFGPGPIHEAMPFGNPLSGDNDMWHLAAGRYRLGVSGQNGVTGDYSFRIVDMLSNAVPAGVGPFRPGPSS